MRGKYRGKDICSGEWVFGYYLGPQLQGYSNKQHCIVQEDDFLMVDVDPKTVGEFTEKKDQNGVELFIGDIVEFACEDRIYRKEVMRSDKLLCVMFGEFSFEYLFESHYFHISNGEFNIIGNVHENPSLLNQVQQ